MLNIEMFMEEFHDIETFDIAAFGKICEAHINAADLKELFAHSMEFFPDRREFCEALEIGESTLSGWIKEDRIPQMAKIVIGLFLFANRLSGESNWHFQQIKAVAYGARLVQDGDNFMVVEFDNNAPRHESGPIGKIIARDIPDEESGRKLISFQQMERLLVDIYKGRLDDPATQDPQWDAYIEGRIEEFVLHLIPELKEQQDAVNAILKEKSSENVTESDQPEAPNDQ